MRTWFLNTFQEAEQLFSTLVKKNSGNKDVWIKFGEFYFQQSRMDSARKLMQRSLKSLDMRHRKLAVKLYKSSPDK